MRMVAAVLAMVAIPAWAVDVTTNFAVIKGGAVVFEQTNRFVGMTDAEAAALQKNGLAVLDFASKQQDRRGDYTIRWQWSGIPQVETTGMTLQGVNATLRKGHKWLDGVIVDSEKREGQKKGRPWGDK